MIENASVGSFRCGANFQFSQFLNLLTEQIEVFRWQNSSSCSFMICALLWVYIYIYISSKAISLKNSFISLEEIQKFERLTKTYLEWSQILAGLGRRIALTPRFCCLLQYLIFIVRDWFRREMCVVVYQGETDTF